MKNAKLLTVLLLLLVIGALALVSCGTSDGDTSADNPTQTKLVAPVVSLNGDTATWAADAYAEKFEISIDGALSYIENTMTSKKLENGQTFKIRAVGNGVSTVTSEWSNSVKYERIDEPTYTIVWKNGDTVLEKDENVKGGDIPTYDGKTPTKDPTLQVEYKFVGWTPEVVAASGDATYTAVFEESTRKYTVIWMNGSQTLEIDSVEYGTVPEYNGAEPQKASTEQYSYKFSGWSTDIGVVVGDATYVAEFSFELRTYTVTWKNGDTVIEVDENVPYGFAPTYDGATPTKDSTDQYDYRFKGWTPAVEAVRGDATYGAEFTSTVKKYTVTFYSEDGTTVLDTVSVEYGSNASYSKQTPVKNATEAYTYMFDKWVTAKGGNVADDLTNVVANREVYASFNAILRSVSVYVVTNNSDYGSVTVTAINNVPYGSAISVNGNKVTINGETSTAIATSATAQYKYIFTGWTADTTVGADTVITANFAREVNKYTVTWKNGDEILEVDSNVEYGATPVYNGATPTKKSDAEYSYTFSGWAPVIASVTGDVTYIAQFTNETNVHTVIFYDEDGITELGRVVVKHGQNAVYPNALPTKEASVDKVFTFDKWVSEIGTDKTASLTAVVDDIKVYAKYSSLVRKYKVTFVDWDGKEIQALEVEYGSAATAPENNPLREGYRFTGWDSEYSFVTGDVTVKAEYIQRFSVTFVDYDGVVIAITLVDRGGSVTTPIDPVRNNYRFVGWNTTVFTNIVSDMTVEAVYVRQYKVTFVDYDGKALKEETVDEGSSATAPKDPELEGYKFVGWDKEFDEIKANTTVTAVYEVKKYTVKFVMPDGTMIGDAQSVDYGMSAAVPEYPDFYVNKKDGWIEIYGFTKWDKSIQGIKEDTVIKAIYDSVYTKPVIIVEYSNVRNGDANIYVYSSGEIILNAVEFKIKYIGDIAIDSVSFNSAGPFRDDTKYEYRISNNENIFSFAWSDANGAKDKSGKYYSGCGELATFSFSVALGSAVSSKTFVIESASAVMTVVNSNEGGESLVQVTPAVVYC